MHCITLQCRTVTPMFSGNAFQKPEIRPTEIKAAMRFWWRAMNAHLTLDELKSKETDLFGGRQKVHGNESGYIFRRSSFNIVVEASSAVIHAPLPNIPYTDNSGSRQRTFNILNYLAYGKWDFRTGFENGYIPTNHTFRIILSMQDKSKEESLKELVWFVGNLGGIGSKTRNGFGRFSIEIPDFMYDPIHIIKAKLKPNIINSFTAFSDKVVAFSSTENHDNWEDALAEIGTAYLESRLEIKHDRYLGEKRKYIGFPLSVREQHGKRMVSKKIGKIERHAKSYFLTVCKADNNQHIGIIIFMPYAYLDKHPMGATDIRTHRDNYVQYTNDFCDSLSFKLDKVI